MRRPPAAGDRMLRLLLRSAATTLDQRSRRNVSRGRASMRGVDQSEWKGARHVDERRQGGDRACGSRLTAVQAISVDRIGHVSLSERVVAFVGFMNSLQDRPDPISSDVARRRSLWSWSSPRVIFLISPRQLIPVFTRC